MKAFNEILKNFNHDGDSFKKWQHILVGNIFIKITSSIYSSIYLSKYYTDYQILLTYRSGYQEFFKTHKNENIIEWEELDELLENDLERAAISHVTGKATTTRRSNASL